MNYLHGRICCKELDNSLDKMHLPIRYVQYLPTGYNYWSANINFCYIGIWIILSWSFIQCCLSTSLWLPQLILSIIFQQIIKKLKCKEIVSIKMCSILYRFNFLGRLIRSSYTWLKGYYYLIYSTKNSNIISNIKCLMGLYSGMEKSLLL